MSRSGAHRLWILLAATAATFSVLAVCGREAKAFCRSTACDPANESCTKDNHGCPRSGPPLSWRTLPLPYRFHAPGSDKLDMDAVREATRRAFDTWSTASCNGKRTSLRFKEGDDIPGKHPLATEGPAKVPFGIYFRDDSWPYSDGDESLALTNQKYGKTNGWIDYSAIEVNTTDREFRVGDDGNGIDFQAVLTHEIGHYIGLAHSEVEGSIMAPSYCQSAERCGAGTSADDARALADDDVDAVCALYPPSGIAGVSYEEPSSSSCALGGGAPRRSPVAPLATIAALGVLAALRKREQRKSNGAV